MKTILVASDFSPAAFNAVNYAADMALSINAKLLLLTVVQTPVGYSELPIVVSLEDMLRSTERDMKHLKYELMLKTGNKLNIETEVGMRAFYSELKDVCERVKPYAVVMGSQGKTAAEHILFGTHAVHAMKNLAWPLITVPPGTKFSAVKKIGLASDLTEVVKTTPIEEIKMLVHDFNAELHVLNTGKTEVFDADIVFESALMQEMMMSLNPKFHFISNGNTDEGIIKFTDENKIDLLIVLPKRHNLFEQMFHKSHTKNLVLHSHVPVMALHQ
ncbi:MAG: universal stress protein [Chitinophagaceae bacterium]|nr:universal stress protein [Chitinophagaceae bacterium]